MVVIEGVGFGPVGLRLGVETACRVFAGLEAGLDACTVCWAVVEGVVKDVEGCMTGLGSGSVDLAEVEDTTLEVGSTAESPSKVERSRSQMRMIVSFTPRVARTFALVG